MRKKYIIAILIVFIIAIPFLLLFFEKQHKVTTHLSTTVSKVSLPTNGSYVTEDSTNAPSTEAAAVEGTITRQTRESNNQIWQKFVLYDSLTGSKRTMFEQIENRIQFEKMTKANWSPTNRFFYVIFDDSSERRNLLIFETDGRFTDTQYYIQPMQLTAFQTVSTVSWSDSETLAFTVTNQKTGSTGKYEVDLNDSSGVLKQIH